MVVLPNVSSSSDLFKFNFFKKLFPESSLPSECQTVGSKSGSFCQTWYRSKLFAKLSADGKTKLPLISKGRVNNFSFLVITNCERNRACDVAVQILDDQKFNRYNLYLTRYDCSISKYQKLCTLFAQFLRLPQNLVH